MALISISITLWKWMTCCSLDIKLGCMRSHDRQIYFKKCCCIYLFIFSVNSKGRRTIRFKMGHDTSCKQHNIPWKNVICSAVKSNEDMILALAGQFKQFNNLRHFIWFQHRTAYNILSYDIPFTGKHEPNKLTCSPLCDFIAQLVRALHRIFQVHVTIA